MNKNIRFFHSRYEKIVIVIAVLMAVLAVRLFTVTILQHDTLDFKWLGGLPNASLNGNFIALRGKSSGIFLTNV